LNINYETIQKGNPFRLTKEQHFIPKAHIKRFENDNKKVFCKNLISKNKKITEINSNDSIFKVQRLWAEFAEKGYMKRIEDKFSRLVDNILDESLKDFTTEQSRVICNMYTLWERRAYHIKEFLKNQNLHIKLNGIDGEIHTLNEKEKIESFHMSYVNENGDISNRDLIGGQIQVYINSSPYQSIEWGIIKSNKLKFIMPSNPCMRNSYENSIIIFPISPYFCLVPKELLNRINDENIHILNEKMIQNASWFYFFNG